MESSLPVDTQTTQVDSMAQSRHVPDQQSPFINPGAVTKANTLAIIQLSKDDLVPVYLRESNGEHDGYKEGHVLNTRFGSFPHSTLIGIPWGSQVAASNVDTGTRGRKKKPILQAKDKGEETPEGLKRKRDSKDEGEKRRKSSAGEAATPAEVNPGTEQGPAAETTLPQGQADAQTEHGQKTPKTAMPNKQAKTNGPSTAQSGFVHILPPTPEIWTSSLPHRTQVVYTPDYSYILQRIRARPGTRIIEAGSGSGSFTHASARAVYDGSPDSRATGRVFSFEFHEQRFQKVKKEIEEHGLSSFVEANHRDVYNEGFLVDGKSPEADAVFLDVPAPWLALPHLSRRKLKTMADVEGIADLAGGEAWVSPLNPKRSVYICTFSPCIEQVTQTVSEMRKLGWVEIDMVEISHKRMYVHRDKIGLDIVSERGQQLTPKNVAEALVKLREIEIKSAEHNAKMLAQHRPKKSNHDDDDDDNTDDDVDTAQGTVSKVNGTSHRHSFGQESKGSSVKSFMQGQLVTRPEPEIKAHTSYLVFAILPREWTEEDEAAAAAKWPIGQEPRLVHGLDRASRKQQKRELYQSKSKKNKKEKKAKAAELPTREAEVLDASTAEDATMTGVEN